LRTTIAAAATDPMVDTMDFAKAILDSVDIGVDMIEMKGWD
ncbi:hypothetical protein Tco_0485905, partial [Tanacetum coccineum]